MAVFQLDCGCEMERSRAVWDYDWHECPNGHGRQQLYRMLQPADHPAATPLIERHLEHRAEFMRRFGSVSAEERANR